MPAWGLSSLSRYLPLLAGRKGKVDPGGPDGHRGERRAGAAPFSTHFHLENIVPKLGMLQVHVVAAHVICI